MAYLIHRCTAIEHDILSMYLYPIWIFSFLWEYSSNAFLAGDLACETTFRLLVFQLQSLLENTLVCVSRSSLLVVVVQLRMRVLFLEIFFPKRHFPVCNPFWKSFFRNKFPGDYFSSIRATHSTTGIFARHRPARGQSLKPYTSCLLWDFLSRHVAENMSEEDLLISPPFCMRSPQCFR